MSLEEYLSIPFVLRMESVKLENGQWVREASYPELPECVIQGIATVELVEKLDQQREQIIRRQFEKGLPIPQPRAPLLA